ncbi:MAG: DsbA family protein [Nitrospinae bacterium]|nr:DsbA family protein [Nitrospinota bacterium]
MNQVDIVHFSDILCVWAYIAQRRMDELKENFGEQITIDYHFASIFGYSKRKIETNWKGKGLYDGYSNHVKEVVKNFPHVSVHPDIWTKNIPESSASCHLFLCSIRLLIQKGIIKEKEVYEIAAWKLRELFFKDLVDVSQRKEHIKLAEELKLPVDKVLEQIDSGEAHAEYCYDLELAKTYDVKVSPSLIFNEGRQKINGNVGYLVIEANIKELLKGEKKQASWC